MSISLSICTEVNTPHIHSTTTSGVNTGKCRQTTTQRSAPNQTKLKKSSSNAPPRTRCSLRCQRCSKTPSGDGTTPETGSANGHDATGLVQRARGRPEPLAASHISNPIRYELTTSRLLLRFRQVFGVGFTLTVCLRRPVSDCRVFSSLVACGLAEVWLRGGGVGPLTTPWRHRLHCGGDESAAVSIVAVSLCVGVSGDWCMCACALFLCTS